MSAAACDQINLSTLSALRVERHETRSPSTDSTVVSYSRDLGSGPVLWLVHGYPQSAFIWRHLVPELQDKISLFIPELPGYGFSTRPNKPGFAAISAALLETSHALFPNRPIILAGHDRGARICHRLSVDNANPPQNEFTHLHSYTLLGTVLVDIVPTVVQWQSFANPKASAAYFHWPFLASPIASQMIEAFGGAKWTRLALDRICGDNPEGRKSFQSDDAWSVYQSLHSKRATIEGSCADYHAGCHDEPQLQEQDQKDGHKIESPALVMWSLGKLGMMHGDVGEIWKDWVKDPEKLTAKGVGNDAGHYLPEEASDVIGPAIHEFLDVVMK